MKRWLLLTLALVSAPALADWQFTRWGMSPDEVVAASQGQVQRVKDKKDLRVRDLPRLAIGQVKEGDVAFDMEFFFKDQKLSFIRYNPIKSMTCSGEEQFFLDRFGPAEATETTYEIRDKHLVLMKTRDRFWKLENGDQLKYETIWFERPDLQGVKTEPMCIALLEPLPSATAPR